eukprot:13049696-Alexandrium_andersonii.AAC.1
MWEQSSGMRAHGPWIGRAMGKTTHKDRRYIRTLARCPKPTRPEEQAEEEEKQQQQQEEQEGGGGEGGA